MSQLRPPAVAGLFYPDQPQVLREMVEEHLASGPAPSRRPLALIVPHAGLVYSGALAGAAYAQLRPWAEQLRRVALFGPCHRVPLRGMAVPGVSAFATPLGEVPLDREALDRLLELDDVQCSDLAHGAEHSLEVQLPYLLSLLGEFRLVPIVVGDASAASVARVMDTLLDEETLLVVSSDLSHFHGYDEAVEIDRETCRAILNGARDLSGEQACGCRGINGLNRLVERHHWELELIGRCNSGDTAGPRDRVVGYGAFAAYAAD